MKQKHKLIKTQPTRRLSWWRVLVAVILIGGIMYSSVSSWQWWQTNKVAANFEPWFAAYVDVTARPIYPFEQLGATGMSQVVLSFIVSDHEDACEPTWGGYYTMDQAAAELDLDRRIARLQQQEGRVAISFGGAINDELALRCQDKTRLYSAYQRVVDRYHIDTIDLDLENEGLRDLEAAARRAEVIGQLQADRRAEGKALAVWLTLPVAPQGLTQEGTDAVAVVLANGVDISGVNVMTMNYGNSRTTGESMVAASQRALIETHRQLGILYQQQGIELSSLSLWRKLGATPMIGQNDVLEEVFTLDDAQGLNQFGLKQGLGRMSMWSANRDIRCGENYVNLSVVSDSCSGVPQDKYSFATALSQGFSGDLTQNSTLVTESDALAGKEIVDDPATSPYQIWQESGAYLEGTKVVWRGNVYQAKWWTKGDLPDNPVLQAWETPWQLVGPVLPGEKPVFQATLPEGTYPEWSGVDIYEAGDRVLFDGIPFQSKWWTQGDSPAAASANADSSPWVALTQAEIEAILVDLSERE